MRALLAAALLLAGPTQAGPAQVSLGPRPLQIELPVGAERLVHFPAHVDVGLPPELAGLLEVTSAGGTVYLAARQPLTGRLRIRESESGAVHFADVRAHPSGPTGELLVTRPGEDAFGLPEVVPAVARAGIEAPPAAPTVTPIDLVRYAWQALYAPRRIAETLDARIPGVTPASLDRRVSARLYPGLRATAVAAWQGGGMTVTAVRLCNDGPLAVEALDPVRVRGEWHSATFVHRRLPPGGMTHLLLTSARPFQASAP